METVIAILVGAAAGFVGGWYAKGKWGAKEAAVITDIRK